MEEIKIVAFPSVAKFLYDHGKGLIINVLDISCAWADKDDPTKTHISFRSEYSDAVLDMSLDALFALLKDTADNVKLEIKPWDDEEEEKERKE